MRGVEGRGKGENGGRGGARNCIKRQGGREGRRVVRVEGCKGGGGMQEKRNID